MVNQTQTLGLILAFVIGVSILALVFAIPTSGSSVGEIASSPLACGAGFYVSSVSEDASGNIAYNCTADNAAETASSPSACAAGQKLTQVTESAAGILSLVCAQAVNAAFTSNTSTCTISSATANLGAFTTSPTYTTLGSTFSHTIIVTLNWKITAPLTVTVNTGWTFAWGTGSAPTCAAANGGTSVGNTYLFDNPIAATTAAQTDYSITVVITGLASTTTYWFDLKVTDSSTASWIYSLPQASVVEY
jgi:hypothetical protein